MLLALILSSVALAAAAQIVLKHGMNMFFHRTGHAFRFDGASIREILRIAPVWIGLGLFGLSAVVWLAVLSRAALSYAYPFAALTYVVTLQTRKGNQRIVVNVQDRVSGRMGTAKADVRVE